MDHKKEEIPMKKLFAMLLALSMMLSCTALAAPEGKAAQTTAQLYINPQLLQGAPEQVMTLVDTINSLVFTTTEGENYMTVKYGANDTDICEYTVAADDMGGLYFFSSLYPNTAILLDFAKLAELIQAVLPVNMDEVAMGLMGTMDQAAELLTPYVNDVAAFIASLENDVVADETGMYLAITSQHLGALLEKLVGRLGNDLTLLQGLDTVLSSIAAMEGSAYDPAELRSMITSLYDEAVALKNAEAMEIGSIGIYDADGVSTLEITLANMLLVSIDAYVYEGMDCVDALVIASQNGTSDWQATYDAILDGTSYDVMFGLSTAAVAGYNYVQVYAVENGQTLAAMVEETVENANTDAEKVTTVLSIDMENGDQTINLGGMAAETVLVDEAAPSLEGKYVLDVMALPVDMLMNGLPVFAENIVTAMPEVIEMLLDALSEVEGLEFLADISLTEEVVVTEPEMTEISTPNEIGTEINSNELPEEAPANITIIPDDEIAPMAAPQTENVIEDM